MSSYYERNVAAMENIARNVGCMSWLMLAWLVALGLIVWRVW